MSEKNLQSQVCFIISLSPTFPVPVLPDTQTNKQAYKHEVVKCIFLYLNNEKKNVTRVQYVCEGDPMRPATDLAPYGVVVQAQQNKTHTRKRWFTPVL